MASYCQPYIVNFISLRYVKQDTKITLTINHYMPFKNINDDDKPYFCLWDDVI